MLFGLPRTHERRWLSYMRDDNTFGAFIRKRRVELDPFISLRKMAELLNLSPVHMSNIETGREPAPRVDVLDNLARVLRLDKQDTEKIHLVSTEEIIQEELE